MFKVEKNVPLPKGVERRSTKWPFADMSIGESVLVPADSAKVGRSVVHQVSKKRGLKFVSRTVDGGVRFWRTA